MDLSTNRRRFLKSTAALAAGFAGASPLATLAQESKSPNERPVFGFLGAGIRFHGVIDQSCRFGPCGAVADVDAVQRGRGIQAARWQHYERDYPISIYNYGDYRRVLDRSDVDAVVIVTPDHWHAQMAVEALQAGKDVYCEKPLTLTIGEGQLIRKALAKHPRVFQVGTQQRTEMDGRFVTAAAMVRENRIGSIRRVTCAIGGGEASPAIPATDPPKHLDWNAWLGQAPMTGYRADPKIDKLTGYGAGHPRSRTHGYFRWWYEYSGGKLTDWGAHHVDIALWALNKTDAGIGPYTVDPMMVEHPVPLDTAGMPTLEDRYNTATRFKARVTFSDGIELDVCNDAADLGFGNGIMFQGEKGRFFVNRGKLTGKPVEDLADSPLPDDAIEKLYGRKVVPNHMGDFVECIKTRQTPISDVESHHRHLTVCHAVNIALRLGRKLVFDPATEDFVGDAQASGMVARERRKGFELVV